jgi:hypothetical protein
MLSEAKHLAYADWITLAPGNVQSAFVRSLTPFGMT